MAQLHEINENEPKRAILVGIQLPGVKDAELRSSLDELSRLVQTLGLLVVGRTSQRRSSEGGRLVIGEGKVKELAALTRAASLDEAGEGSAESDSHEYELQILDEEEEDGWQPGGAFVGSMGDSVNDFGRGLSGATPSLESSSSILTRPLAASERPNAVVFDCELSPSQIRNLERALGCEVMDRTGVIIEIFSRHARTRAARLQVEIARLTYLAPRLREKDGGSDRGGGGVGAKGAGETDLELDRRKIRDRIKELRGEFGAIEREHETRRSRREDIRCVALVGYTNAGKSSMMRALTGSEVLVADKLFATLDTTVRPLFPPTVPQILISDTVGFIKKLPHDLVASFKSTLDEALTATLLLYVVDCSDFSFREQLEVTKSVLAEVGAGEATSRLVLNKVDKIDDTLRAQLETEFPDAIVMSTKSKDDVALLREQLIHFFEGDMLEQQLFVPYLVQGAIGEIRSRMRVLEESYDGAGVTLLVRTTEAELARVKARFSIE